VLTLGLLCGLMKGIQDAGPDIESEILADKESAIALQARLQIVEQLFVLVYLVFWIGGHIYVFFWQGSLYQDWETTFADENEAFMTIADFTKEQNKQMLTKDITHADGTFEKASVTFSHHQVPDPPRAKADDRLPGVPELPGFYVEAYGLADVEDVSPDEVGERGDFFFQGCEYRVKNPKEALDFYCGRLGFVLIYHHNFLVEKREDTGPFSIYYLAPRGALTEEDLKELEDHENTLAHRVIATKTPGGLKLVWKHGTEDRKEGYYNTGNRDFKGTRSGKPIVGGYHGITISVNDVKAFCRDLQGVKVIKQPGSFPPLDSEMAHIAPLDAAQIEDPDGYCITLLQRAA